MSFKNFLKMIETLIETLFFNMFIFIIINRSIMFTIENKCLSSFSYDTSILKWDKQHRTNEQRFYCYCGKDIDANEPTIFCDKCSNRFHVKCLSFKINPVRGEWGYRFVCAGCDAEKKERFGWMRKSWSQIARIAAFHCSQISNSSSVHVSDQIVKLIDKHFDSLAFGKIRTPTWQSTVQGTLSSRKEFQRDTSKRENGWWMLTDPTNPQLQMDGPKGLKHTITEAPVAQPPTQKKTKSSSSSRKRKKTKRQYEEEVLSSSDSEESDVFARPQSPPKSTKYRNIDGMPLHGAALSAAKAFKSAQEEADSLTRGSDVKNQRKQVDMVYWETEYYAPDAEDDPTVALAKKNTSKQVVMDERRLVATNTGGYRLIRASHPAVVGRFYYEVEFVKGAPENAHIRVGFATEKADMQAPCGYDGFGYSIRDIDGSVFHRSRGRAFANRSIQPGDVIGCLIDLKGEPLHPGNQGDITEEELNDSSMVEALETDGEDVRLMLPPTEAEKKAKENNGKEEEENQMDMDQDKAQDRRAKTYYHYTRPKPAKPPQATKPPDPVPEPPVKGSYICFYLNGEPLRPQIASEEQEGHECPFAAFRDIHGGLYYPAVSCYNGAKVRLAFGAIGSSEREEKEEGQLNPQEFRHFPSDVDNLQPFAILGPLYERQHKRALEIARVRKERREQEERLQLEKAAAQARLEDEKKAMEVRKELEEMKAAQEALKKQQEGGEEKVAEEKVEEEKVGEEDGKEVGKEDGETVGENIDEKKLENGLKEESTIIEKYAGELKEEKVGVEKEQVVEEKTMEANDQPSNVR